MEVSKVFSGAELIEIFFEFRAVVGQHMFDLVRKQLRDEIQKVSHRF